MLCHKGESPLFKAISIIFHSPIEGQHSPLDEQNHLALNRVKYSGVTQSKILKVGCIRVHCHLIKGLTHSALSPSQIKLSAIRQNNKVGCIVLHCILSKA
jgi:hypothetical protein